MVTILKKLLSVNLGTIYIVNFAAKLRNAVSSMKFLNGIGYLLNPELPREILHKLPPTIASVYIKYAAVLNDSTVSNLENVANFVYSQAQM